MCRYSSIYTKDDFKIPNNVKACRHPMFVMPLPLLMK